MTETHTSILAHYREQSSAVDEVYASAIAGLNTRILELEIERDDLVRARNKAQAGLDDEACRRLHVKLDDDSCPVARQGKPRKAAEPGPLTLDIPITSGPNDTLTVVTAAVGIGGAGGTGLSTVFSSADILGGAGGSETPTLLPPGGTTEPAVVAGVAEASSILAAPAGEAPTAAETFIDAVSEPEATLLRNGFSPQEIGITPPAARHKLRELDYKRDAVMQLSDGTWEEAPF